MLCNYIYMGNKFNLIIILLMSVSNTVMAGGGDIKSAVESKAYNVANQAFTHGNSAIESWARNNISSLRLLELETKIRDSSKPHFRLLSVFELTGNEHNALLSQISFSTFDDRETFNAGIVYRTFNSSKTVLYGTNFFFDQQLHKGHQRFGIGFEIKSSAYDFNLNFYDASSDIHHIDGVPEVAAGGYDAEIGMTMPFIPWAKLYYKAYQWNNQTLNIKNGENLSIYMEPTSRFSLEAGLQDDSSLSTHKSYIKLNYIFCCADDKSRPSLFTTSSKAFNYVPLDNKRMYEKVRRENNIIVVRGGGEIAVTASGF